MNKSTTKKWLKIGIIALALLLTIALGIGASAAWYTAKRQATGTILMNSGIEIQYKGFGQTTQRTGKKKTVSWKVCCSPKQKSYLATQSRLQIVMSD